MDAGLEAELPPPLRLALAWATPGTRAATRALFALDTRLAGSVRRGTEPLPLQMRLAWWRDTLGAPPEGWPRGDPLLDELRGWNSPAQLVPLVDGWERLLADDLDSAAIRGFAVGREKGWSALARHVGAPATEAGSAVRAWALADLAANLSAAEERARVLDEARGMALQLPRERALRPLAVLGGLGWRALQRGGAPLLDGRASALVALRLGMLGR